MAETIFVDVFCFLYTMALILIGIHDGIKHQKKRDAAEDKVHVIRCEKCKYWDPETKEIHTYSSEDNTPADFCECTYWSGFFKCYMTRFNDYCSIAERKDK